MRRHREFNQMKGERNPCVKQLRQPVTIRLDKSTIAYFKALADELGMPYQNLINLHLKDCAVRHRKLKLNWVPSRHPTAASSGQRSALHVS